MPINRNPTARLNLSLVDRIKNGKLVPVISGEVIHDLVLGGDAPLVAGYADYIQYPLADRDNLPKMAKYKSITDDLDDYTLKHDYLYFVKSHIYALAEGAGCLPDLLAEAEAEVNTLLATDFAARLGYPTFAKGAEEPLLILADLPLPIYITTSVFGFVEAALRRAGKDPRSEICRWNTGLDSTPSAFSDPGYEPTVQQPLVYHLHGLDSRPDSLVLTEDDYLAHLAFIAQGQGKNVDPIPLRVRRAISDSALVVLGYRLPSWGFRSLFWGLIRAASTNNKGICCLQLTPTQEEKDYLKGYLDKEARLDVYWGEMEQYTRELSQIWKA